MPIMGRLPTRRRPAEMAPASPIWRRLTSRCCPTSRPPADWPNRFSRCAGPRFWNDGGVPTFAALPPLPDLPRRLAAEPPGWVREVNVVVVGSGIAGLTAALECRDLGNVMVVT